MIIVDVHEPQEIKGQFKVIRHLQRGDYDIKVDTSQVLIERKTMTDGISSWIDGRLDRQVCCVDALLIEKNIVPSNLSHLETRFKKHLNTLSFNMPVIYSNSKEETVAELKRIEYKLRRGGLNLRSLEKPYSNHKITDPNIIALLALPDIGLKSAETIHGTYNSYGEALRHIEEWTALDGIGEKRVQTIREVLQL